MTAGDAVAVFGLVVSAATVTFLVWLAWTERRR